NGRFYHLAFSNTMQFHQVGSDQGLLPSPVPLNLVTIAPGERADLIADFASHAGETITLNNAAESIMQIRISRSATRRKFNLPATLRAVPRIAEAEAIVTRPLTLDMYRDRTRNPLQLLLNRTHWDMPVTERPVLDTVEIWSFINLTEDTHPIHLHLVRFQVLD